MNPYQLRHYIRRLTGAIAGLLLAAGSSVAQPTGPVEVAEGIDYVRIGQAATAVASRPTVFDARLQPAPTATPAWATATGPTCIVMVDGEHAATWAQRLTARAANILLLAPTDAGTVADLTVSIGPAGVQRAVTAIEAGADLPTLAVPAIEKQRFDEASLIRRRQGDNTEAPNATPATTAPDETDRDAEPPVSDPMLQRAVQVLQGLRVLGRG